MAAKGTSIFIGLLLPLLFFTEGLWILKREPLTTEFDGIMQFYAAANIFKGTGYVGWASHFWPPLFGTLMAAFQNFIDPLVAGKMISLISAVLILVLIYYFVQRATHSRSFGVLCQMAILANSTFFASALEAENHMLDSLFYVAAVSLAIHQRPRTVPWMETFLLGVLSGFAGLTRYTSYSLVPVVLMIIFWGEEGHRKRWLKMGLYIFCFFMINLPWYLFNLNHNGSPLHTWQYLNIGSHIFPLGELRWWWEGQKEFQNLSQVITAYPIPYLNNFSKNFTSSIEMLFESCRSFIYGLLLLALWTQRKNIKQLNFKEFVFSRPFNPEQLIYLLLFLTVYTVLVSQAFVFGEVFLSWSILLPAFTLALFNQFLTTAKIRICVLSILVIAGSMAHFENLGRVKIRIDKQQPLQKVQSFLLRDPLIKSKTVLSANASYAYAVGAQYLMLPLYFGDKNVWSILTYQDLDEKIRWFAPKEPFNLDPLTSHFDYLIIDEATKRMLPTLTNQLRALTQSKMILEPIEIHGVQIYQRTIFKNRYMR